MATFTPKTPLHILKVLTPPTLPRRPFSTSPINHTDFTHIIIGAGAVGLAIARQLATKPNTTTLLLERHGLVGSETSSRNSEVIHAGLYYGPNTLKTTLCIKGRQLLYDLCQKHAIPHRNTRKWIVAQDEEQLTEVNKVHAFSKEVGVPTHFLSRREIASREPDIRAEAGALESPSTGILDSHAYMNFLEGSFTESGGELVLHTHITSVERTSHGTYKVHSTTSTGEPNDPIESEVLINSAGLNAIPVSNMLLPTSRQRKAYFAKGNYFSYSASHPKPSTLIYPAPVPGLGGLGTHLTLDMSGRVRFGPDVEWVTDPTDLTPNPARLADAIKMIKTYLPSIDTTAIDLDYCGIRPKLGRSSGTAGPTFADFYICEEEGYGGFVNLLGIESPGLTCSLAIGEFVEGLLYGSGNRGGRGSGNRGGRGSGLGQGGEGEEAWV